MKICTKIFLIVVFAILTFLFVVGCIIGFGIFVPQLVALLRIFSQMNVDGNKRKSGFLTGSFSYLYYNFPNLSGKLYTKISRNLYISVYLYNFYKIDKLIENIYNYSGR